jgi:hypothetical protein
MLANRSVLKRSIADIINRIDSEPTELTIVIMAKGSEEDCKKIINEAIVANIVNRLK